MRPTSILAATALAIAGVAAAQMPTRAPGSHDPALVTGGAYKADPGHTLVTWTVDHMGFTPYTGMIGDVTGTLTLDPRDLSKSKVDVTIPVSRITTVNAALTAHLTGAGKSGAKPDFLGPNAADAHFVSTSVVARGETARITGTLTLNGVSRPVTLDASFYGAGKPPPRMGAAEVIGFHATATIMRSQFGLGFGVPMVGDSIHLDIAAGFQK